MFQALFIVAIGLTLHPLSTVEIDAATKATISKSYKAIDKTITQSKYDGLKRYFDEKCSFKRLGEPGIITTKTFLAGMKGMDRQRKILKSATTVMGLKPIDKGVEATIEWQLTSAPVTTSSSRGQTVGKAKKGTQTIVDEWQKKDGQWRIVKRLIKERD